jgi:predicted membrane-bound spermidine synthase
MISITWQSVLDQITAFTSSSIIAGYVPYILGLGIGAYVIRLIVSTFLGR